MKRHNFMKTMFVFVLVAILALTSCSKSNSDNSSKEEYNSGSDSASLLPTKDRTGKDISIPKKVDKIISLAVSINQEIDDLELSDKLVGIDTNSKDSIKALKDLTAYDMLKPDVESMLSKKPDIVFISGMSTYSDELKKSFKKLSDAGICIAEIPTSNSIEDIKKDVEFVADCLGKHDEGLKLTKQMQDKIDEVSKIGKTIKNKKSVLFEIAPSPNIYTFGKDVYLDEMINIIGAKNVFAKENSWIPATVENSVKANPDVILTNVGNDKTAVNDILKDKAFAKVKAVTKKNVYHIDNLSSSVPNHNITKALVEMAKAIYPNEYKDVK